MLVIGFMYCSHLDLMRLGSIPNFFVLLAFMISDCVYVGNIEKL